VEPVPKRGGNYTGEEHSENVKREFLPITRISPLLDYECKDLDISYKNRLTLLESK